MTMVVSSDQEKTVVSGTNVSLSSLANVIDNKGNLNDFVNNHPELSLSQALDVLNSMGMSHKVSNKHFVRKSNNNSKKSSKKN